MKLLLDTVQTPIGKLSLVSMPDDTLIHLDFENGDERMHQILSKRFRSFELVDGSVPSTRSSLQNYFAGQLDALDPIKCDLFGSDFQRTVWEALRTIKKGTTISYQELASRIGKPKAIRAVANANALNPISLIYPCHRVIGRDGHLRGYAGGLAAKDWLLRHEGVPPTWI